MEPEVACAAFNFILGPETTAPDSDCRFTHPLIYLLHYCLGQTLRDEGIVPDMLLGYSLGELTACALADTISFAEGMNLATKAGHWVADNTPEMGMMTVLASPEIANDYFPLFEETTIACSNYPSHFVLTGASAQLGELADQLRNDEIALEILPIRRGFHSATMDELE